MMNLFEFLESLRRKPSQQLSIKIVERQRSSIRLSDWQSDKSLTTAAGEYLAQPTLQFMLDVLRNEHPGRFVLSNVSNEQRAIQQARSEGYEMCLANFDALSKFVPLLEPIQAEYQEDK